MEIIGVKGWEGSKDQFAREGPKFQPRIKITNNLARYLKFCFNGRGQQLIKRNVVQPIVERNWSLFCISMAIETRLKFAFMNKILQKNQAIQNWLNQFCHSRFPQNIRSFSYN